MKNSSPLIIIALLTAALCSTPTTVHAQGGGEVDAASMELAAKAYQDGMRAYDNQEYERAIQALRLSYTIIADPLILYNIAIIEVEAQRYDDALVTMAQAREVGLPADDDAKNAARTLAIEMMLGAREAAPHIGRASSITFSDVAPSKDDGEKPLWPPLLCAAAGGAALIGAATIDFRIIEERQVLDQLAKEGDGPGYTAQLNSIEILQRRGRIALGAGAALTVTGIIWTVVRMRKNAKKSTPTSQESALQLSPWLAPTQAGAMIFTRF